MGLWYFIRLLAFFASWMGWCALLEKRWKVQIYFTPMVTMAAQVMILFLAGLLNLLPLGTMLLFLGGLLCFVLGIWQNRKDYFLPFCRIGFFFFTILTLGLWLATRGQRIFVNDDFSHWAMIVKQMLLDHRYPNFENMILFQSYPPGTATLIYYVVTLTGGGEDAWLFAQSLMYPAFLLPLFLFTGKENRWLCLVFSLLFANLAAVYSIMAHAGLCVDSVLALAGAGTMLYVWYYGREAGGGKSALLYWAIPLMAFCILIKNSGLLFTGICSAFLLWKQFRSPGDPADRKRSFLTALCPYAALLLWQKHCDLVYTHAGYSKHALSLDYMGLVSSQKDSDYLLWLFKRVILFSLEGKELYLTLAFLALTLAVVLLCAPRLKKSCGKLLLALGAFYVIYQFGLYLVYVFSMSQDQGTHLAGGIRYRRTVLLMLLYFASVMTMCALSQAKLRQQKGILGAALALAALLLLWGGDLNFAIMDRKYSSSLREKMELVLSRESLPEGASFLVVNSSGEEAGMELFIGPYLTLSHEVIVLLDPTEEQLNDSLKAYQYMMILDSENPAVQNWVGENYPEQQGRQLVDLWKGDTQPPAEATAFSRINTFLPYTG